MIAYFVHNSETKTDTIYLPDRQSSYPVDRARILTFIKVEPDFSRWSNGIVVPPEEFGGVIALRDGKGEVSVLNLELWQQRLTAFLGDLFEDTRPLSDTDSFVQGEFGPEIKNSRLLSGIQTGLS